MADQTVGTTTTDQSGTDDAIAQAGAVNGQDASVQTASYSAPQAAAEAPISAPVSSPLSGSTPPVEQINREFQENSALKRAKELGLPYINLSTTPLNPDFFKVIPLEDAKRARIIPFFKAANKIKVALDDENNTEALNIVENLKSQGYKVDITLSSSAALDDALKIYDNSPKYKKPEIIQTVEEKSIKTYEKEIAELKDIPMKLESITAEEGLNLLNIGAMKTKASDIHYEPNEKFVEVRFRIDGVLHKVFEIRPDVYSKISEQIKYKSKMRMNVTTVPQDGRYVFMFNKIKVAVRVSSIPTPYGESFVCRFLPAEEKFLTFEELGFDGLALVKLQKAAKISQGMVLVTGPTGSGKSTTLYSLLNQMNTPENKIITLEDPVEYYMNGVTQSQIDEKRNYTFASGLRSILRQDPDIVMIGEIRDIETAETASQAALTGHVLLSTLHTNSALEAIPRLINMGLPPFMVAPSLNTVVAQRLVRRVCSECSTMEPISESERAEFEEVIKGIKAVNPGIEIEIPEQISKVHGCDACSNTGYNGRIVIAEVFSLSEEIKSLILNNASSIQIIAAARKEGMITMREDGFLKVAKGLTTLEEVHRVTNFSL